MSEQTQRSRTVGILAFDEMEVLDYAGPYEVFNVAGEVDSLTRFEVAAIGLSPGPVTGRGGFTVMPATTILETMAPEILIVPGGVGSRSAARDPELLYWLRNTAVSAELVVSVCTGALILAAAGLLEGCRATTHHQAFEELAMISPSTEILQDCRYVQSSERVWTSGGVSAGIDISLHIVGLLAGTDTRDLVIDEMEWGW